MFRILFIAILMLVAFLIEFIFFNQFGRWLKPDLLLLLVIYFNLAFGIRFSLVTALFAGILRDSFSINVFGMNIFAFLLCAYLTTLIKRYLFHMGSTASRVLIVLIISTFYCLVLYILNSLFSEVNFGQMIAYVWFPQILITMLLANHVFRLLRKCVLKYSI